PFPPSPRSSVVSGLPRRGLRAQAFRHFIRYRSSTVKKTSAPPVGFDSPESLLLSSRQSSQKEVLMQKSWQIQEAKNKLSEVVEEAIENGPQILTRRGVEIAVVLSFSEYQQMRKKQTSLSEFFQRSPLAELDLERDRSPVRPGPQW